MLKGAIEYLGAKLSRWTPEERDAVLYGSSTLFAALIIFLSTFGLYREWAELAIGPYAVAAAASAFLAWRAKRRSAVSNPGHYWTVPRMSIILVALVGSTLLPLSLEVLWRSDQGTSTHVQPEVEVVEEGAQRISTGKNLYQYVTPNRPIRVPAGQPEYNAYFPYLPGMVIFGLPYDTDVSHRLTDARVVFSITTVLLVIGALLLCRGPSGPRVVTLQAMTVLPTAALPLATGGDDLPVAAAMLVALLFLQRRRPIATGIMLGIASSLKFTAWPLAAIALLVVRDEKGRRAIGRMVAGMAIVVIPTVLPALIQNPAAFVENVIRFPLGLGGIGSPAASSLPGHIFVSIFPWLHRTYSVVFVIGGFLGLLYALVRHPPHTPAELSRFVAWTMAALILFAPSTRVGYLLYPINFWVWSWLLGKEPEISPEVRELAGATF